MRLASESTSELVFQARRPAGGGIGVGVLFLVSAVLPHLAPAMTTLHWLTSAALLAIGLVLITANWPRATRIRVALRDQVIHGPGHPVAFADVLELELGGLTDQPEETPAPRYEVRVRARAGRELVLISGDDPASVLRDLARLLKHCDFTLRLGWGLPVGAEPWVEAPRGATQESRTDTQDVKQRRVLIEPRNPSLPGGITSLVGGVGVGLMWGVDLYRRAESGLPLSGLSITLAVVFSGLLILLGLALVSYKLVLLTGDRIALYSVSLGLQRQRFEVASADLRAAHAVGPDGEDAWHILLETTNGPQAIPCLPSSAAEVLQVVRRQPPL